MDFDYVELTKQPAGARAHVWYRGSGSLECMLMDSSQWDQFAGGYKGGYDTFTVNPPGGEIEIPYESTWYVVLRGVGEAEVAVSPPVGQVSGAISAELRPAGVHDLTPDDTLPHLLRLPFAAPDWVSPIASNANPLMDNPFRITPPSSDSIPTGSLLAEVNRMNDDARAIADRKIDGLLTELYAANLIGNEFIRDSAMAAIAGQISEAEIGRAKIPDYSGVDKLYINDSKSNSIDFTYNDLSGNARQVHIGRTQDVISLSDQNSAHPKDSTRIASYWHGKFAGISDYDWASNSQFVDTDTFLKNLAIELGLSVIPTGPVLRFLGRGAKFVGPRLAAWIKTMVVSAQARKVPPPLVRATPYRTGGIKPQYVGEQYPTGWFGEPGVRYLDDAGREKLRITIRDGLVYDAKGNLFDTRAGVSAFGPANGGRAIFVMDGNGNLYASLEQRAGEFHHSSFFGGREVAAAGELEVRDGRMQMITDHSGHYAPGRSRTQQVLDQLASQGIVVDPKNVDYWALPGT